MSHRNPPLHPLVVHASVVLTPLLIAVSLARIAVPYWSGALDWAVIALAIVTPIAAVATKLSGDALKAERYEDAADTEQAWIDQHERWGIPAVASAVGLSVFSLARVLVGGAWGGFMTAVLTGFVLLFAAAAAFFVVRAGHSGATTVWSTLQR
ncbi:DUF2231 domain-containing protein [Promicromonospora sp. NPDC023987]|uniref:DUF2231 domain-containing protein n=1 Tax=Promicromonospora sp. NPDC023987 TaxID=3155360 RepID=UPI0033C3AC13